MCILVSCAINFQVAFCHAVYNFFGGGSYYYQVHMNAFTVLKPKVNIRSHSDPSKKYTINRIAPIVQIHPTSLLAEQATGDGLPLCSVNILLQAVGDLTASLIISLLRFDHHICGPSLCYPF